MKLLYSRFHIAIFDIFGDISGAGLSQGPAFGALYRALGAPDKKMIETRNRVRVWGKLCYFRSYVENVDSFWVLLSTKIDWNTESRKLGKSESLKCRQIRKKNFPRFSWTKWSPNPKKKQKWKFWKVRTFPPPGSAQQGPRADALGNNLISKISIIRFYTCFPPKLAFFANYSPSFNSILLDEVYHFILSFIDGGAQFILLWIVLFLIRIRKGHAETCSKFAKADGGLRRVVVPQSCVSSKLTGICLGNLEFSLNSFSENGQRIQ